MIETGSYGVWGGGGSANVMQTSSVNWVEANTTEALWDLARGPNFLHTLKGVCVYMHIWEQRSCSVRHVLSDGPLQWLNKSLSGYYSCFISKPGNIPHIPSTRIGILATALRANQPVYASLSVDPCLFVRAGPKMVRTGTVGRQRASNPQTIGKASVKQTKQSEEGPQTNKYFHL